MRKSSDGESMQGKCSIWGDRRQGGIKDELYGRQYLVRKSKSPSNDNEECLMRQSSSNNPSCLTQGVVAMITVVTSATVTATTARRVDMVVVKMVEVGNVVTYSCL